MAKADLPPITTPAIGLDPEHAAASLGLSRESFDRLSRSERFGPMPIHLGERMPRWSALELEAWIAAGGPSRIEWQRLWTDCRQARIEAAIEKGLNGRSLRLSG